MELRGELWPGEARRTGFFVRNRLLGRGRLILPAMWTAIVVAGLLGADAASEYPRLGAVIFIGMTTAFGLALWIYNGWYQRAVLHAWIARGALSPDPIVYRIADEGLVLAGRRSTTLPWPVISEISLGGLNWVIFCDTMAYYLPRRLFADPAEESEFIGACRERLGPAAKARCIGP